MAKANDSVLKLTNRSGGQLSGGGPQSIIVQPYDLPRCIPLGDISERISPRDRHGHRMLALPRSTVLIRIGSSDSVHQQIGRTSRCRVDRGTCSALALN
jgi:hypothetical protein